MWLCVWGRGNDIVKFYLDLFSCQIGYFSTKYLVVHVSSIGLKISDWEYILAKFLLRGNAWVGNAVIWLVELSFLMPLYPVLHHMLMSLSSKIFVEKLDKIRRRFFS